MAPPRSLTVDERRVILEQRLQGYAKDGYRVLSQADTTAQLMKPKRFNFILALILLCLGGFPLIIYIFWYLAAKDQTMYLTVEVDGKVRVQ